MLSDHHNSHNREYRIYLLISLMMLVEIKRKYIESKRSSQLFHCGVILIHFLSEDSKFQFLCKHFFLSCLASLPFCLSSQSTLVIKKQTTTTKEKYSSMLTRKKNDFKGWLQYKNILKESILPTVQEWFCNRDDVNCLLKSMCITDNFFIIVNYKFFDSVIAVNI